MIDGGALPMRGWPTGYIVTPTTAALISLIWSFLVVVGEAPRRTSAVSVDSAWSIGYQLPAIQVRSDGDASHSAEALNTLVGQHSAHQTAYARDTAIVSDAIACPTCRIILSPTRSYGLGSRDSASPAAGPEIVAFLDMRRRLVVLEKRFGMNKFLFLYGDGGNLMQTVGRSGDGPGEFRAPSTFTLTSNRDSILAFDESTREMIVFDHLGRLVRSARLPITVYDVLSMPNGHLIVAANPRTPATAGLTIHILAADGTIVRSLHPAVAFSPSRPPGPLPYLMAATPDGGFVVVDPRFMTVTVYDAVGDVQAVLRRDAQWARRRVPRDTIRAQGLLEQTYSIALAPAPRIRSVHVDKSNRLWLVAMLDKPDWRANSPVFRATANQSPSFLEQFWVGHIEVVDLTSKTLLVSDRLPFLALRLLEDGLLLRGTEDGLGSLQFETYSVVLER